jgi:hypothetical protein
MRSTRLAPRDNEKWTRTTAIAIYRLKAAVLETTTFSHSDADRAQ